MEEYFSASRLLELDLGSVFQINEEGQELQYTVCLIGVDNAHSVIMSLPAKDCLPNNETYNSVFLNGAVFEMKTVYDGRIVAFESTIVGIYGNRMLIGSFPEMIETRKLRRDTRFPCALSCDIHLNQNETYGVISNISIGGCQLNVERNNEYAFISEAQDTQQAIELEIYFPFSEVPIVVEALVKSSACQIDGPCKIGLAFEFEYECIQKYLDSLQLYNVSPFFS